MNPRISVLTLAVSDFDRSVAFYRDGLGFKTEGIIGTEFENGAVASFELERGLRLALWPRKSLAAETGPGMYQWKKVWQWARASCRQPKRSGKSGRYFRVLNCASLKGLSSLV